MAHLCARAHALLALLLLLKETLSVNVSCDVTAKPGGLFQYQLSPGPGPECEDQSWEDQNRTVVTRGSRSDPKLVHSLTNQVLVLKKCLPYVRFTAQCSDVLEAQCFFNCSSVPAASDLVNPTNNVCFGELCFEMTRFILTCATLLVSVALAGLALWGFYRFKKRRGRIELERRVRELEQPQKNQDIRLQERQPLQEPPQEPPQEPLQEPESCASLSDVRVD